MFNLFQMYIIMAWPPNCRGRTLDDTIGDKTVERLLVKVSSSEFMAKTSDSLLLGREVGNMYCASLYGGLASLFATYDTKSDVSVSVMYEFTVFFLCLKWYI